MDAGSIENICGFGRFVSILILAVVFSFVSGIGKQFPAFIGMDVVVDCLL